jgi:hypothetical protein
MYTPNFIRLCEEILEEGVTKLAMGEDPYRANVRHIVDGQYQIVSINSSD